jgi:hypothetical protein
MRHLRSKILRRVTSTARAYAHVGAIALVSGGEAIYNITEEYI